MSKRPITVLIVDDSKVSRDLLTHIIKQDPALSVVGYAEDGEKTVKWLAHHTADVITMDIYMPGLTGFAVTRHIMETRPTPIVIISAGYAANNAQQGFQAMEAGALAILEKPAGFGDADYFKKAEEIVRTIKTVAEVKLVKRRSVRSSSPPALETQEAIEAVAIAASLGGPAALSTILAALPSDFPVPLLIVQHIAPGFTQGFVKWLQGFSRLIVCMAEDGEKARPGHCYIAPAGGHMEIQSGGIIALDYTSKDTLRPSASRLFKSMAETYGSRGVGVILSGMGSDGALELLQMRAVGAYTIAQDEETCIMFGMPHEAIKIGAVRSTLPLYQIAGALTSIAANCQKH